MTAWGNIGRDASLPPAYYAATIPGALGMGNVDFSREVPVYTSTSTPTVPVYGQIFPRGFG